MESPGIWIFGGILLASLPVGSIPLVFAALWIGHYGYRGLLYPRLIRSTRRVPASVVLLAVGFHAVNATLQASEIFRLRPRLPAGWLWDPRFMVGLVLFVWGFALTTRADARLRALRPRRGQEYRVPRGGMFERVSCPNYLGEIVEWAGWAMLTWSWAGLVFALWTVSNLVPRALALHRWCQATFPDYPPRRKALIPFIL
jgi:protein-S-isoprenylcysteine O-methyltransferase Ste14